MRVLCARVGTTNVVRTLPGTRLCIDGVPICSYHRSQIGGVHMKTSGWVQKDRDGFVASILRSRVFLRVLVATVLLLGLGALPSRGQDRDQDRDRDRAFRDREHGPILIVSYERMPRDFGGGPGGRPAPDAQCDAGFVAVGFHVQTGEFFNQAWLDCAAMRSDGSLGEERRMTSRTGSPGGRPVFDAPCPNGRALRGLRGRTGASIDEAAGMCSFVRDLAQRFENPDTQMTAPVIRPQAGGRPSQSECPAGSVVTGFRSMSGEYMDHLWLMCSALERSY